MKISPLVAFSLLVCFGWCLPAARAQSSGVQFITSVTTGRLRSNFSGWVGMQITIGSNPLNLTALCRYVLSGDSHTHTVELVNNGAVINGSSVSVDTSGVTPGSFACTDLANGITLNANSSYMVLSQETAGGDTWVDYDTTVTNTSDAAITNAAYSFDNVAFNVFSQAHPNRDLVPVGFLYGVVLTPPPPPPNGTQLITSVATGTPRSDFSGWVGMQITVGNSPLNLTALCRYVLSGNSQTHTVELVSNGAVIDGSSVSVDTSGVTPGSFACTNLASGITLNANSSYMVLSQETAGGDTWVDYDTTVTNTSDAAITNAAYSFDNVAFNVFSQADPNHDIGPVGLTYAVISSPPPSISVSISPISTSLQVGQTQQFTATVSGSNTAVSWAVNGAPGGNATVGTIDATGLYTAPAIAPPGTLTVTAQSLAQSTATASATVSITAPTISVSLSPTNPSLQVGQSLQFNAMVSGTSNTAVNWLVSNIPGGNTAVGTISAAGLYTAPAAVPNASVTVTAQSAANPSSAATTSVTFTAAVAHHVDLSWTANASESVAGYNVYRGTQAAGPFTQINSSLLTATVYTDSTVASGQTYYYTTTAVDSSGEESGYSNVVQAVIP
jgi:hypothetical protein